MLVSAAAQKWNVPVSQCRAENNAVVNTQTNARLSYGSLAEAASKLPVPQAPMMKDPSKFRIVGKPMKRRDTPLKVNGTANFALDMKLPGMLYAVVARSAAFGGKVNSFDATKAKAVPGVKHVVQISNGVAVVADNTWAAIEGRKALQLQIDDGPRGMTSSETIRKTFMDLAAKPGAVAYNEGNVETALAGAAKKLDAVYEVPYLAHSPMEPLNCTAHVQETSCDIWTGSQMQTAAQQAGMRITGCQPRRFRFTLLSSVAASAGAHAWISSARRLKFRRLWAFPSNSRGHARTTRNRTSIDLPRTPHSPPDLMRRAGHRMERAGGVSVVQWPSRWGRSNGS